LCLFFPIAVLLRPKAILQGGPLQRGRITGGLISYGLDSRDLYSRSAGYVDRILKGAKPAHLPVQRPTKYEMFVNLSTARALGLTVPDKLLLMADEIIE
jgi:putative ABC transport system substrate-binding protein